MSLHAPFKRRARLPKSVRWSAQAASPALRVTAHSMLHRALSGAGGRITKLLDPAFLLTPQWAYIFKSVASAALAYLVAYVLQLETPYSAASTVLLVTHMNQGVVLAKGSWRLIGTMIGGLVAILLMGLFIQAPSLFLISFGVWLGLCSMAATVLRHFRAVGAAVAGYTVGFATYGALEMPEHALNVVLGRTATVAVGVACLGLVTALFSKRATRERLEAAIAHQINNVGKLVLDRVSREHSADASPDLVAGSFAIDDLLELSRSESPEVAICADAVREGLASLFGATLGAMEIAFGATFNQPAVVAAREQISSHLPDAMRLVESGQESQVKKALATVAQLRHRLNAIAKDSEANGTDPQVLVTLDLLSEIVADWEGAVIGLVRLYNGRAHHSPDFRFHRDWEGGTRNAIRSVIGIVSGGAFGIATGWHDWSLLLLLLAPYSVILATTGNPTAGAVSFVKGTAAAAIPAFICAFFILPEIQGFPFLIIVMVPFWIAGLYATTIPRYTFAGLAYLVAFNTFISATNPMTFDMPGYFNKVLGWMIAVIATWLVLKLVLESSRFPWRPFRLSQAAMA
ncbi:FUSC family protein [Cupriavidus metallidurans]|uniref:FUSC family protein n=2 Tax=Cupriavidus metallidurans TaxID=119219 RepID=A0A482IX30_9BURK|nr:FUSC family protein [Cupriavidus metallidurans]